MSLLSLKRRILLHVLFTVFSLFLQQQVLAQANENVSFSLLTVAPGDQAYNIFGHTALRMNPDPVGRDVVFNYGTFDPTMDFFIPKFLRGKLPYRLSLNSYANFLKNNYAEGRAVWEQELNLDPEAKIKLIAFLENNSLPENREYLYCLLYTSPSPRDATLSRMPSSA